MMRTLAGFCVVVVVVVVVGGCGRPDEGIVRRKLHTPERTYSQIETREGGCVAWQTTKTGEPPDEVTMTTCAAHSHYQVRVRYLDDADWVVVVEKCNEDKSKCKVGRWYVTEPVWREAPPNEWWSAKNRGASKWDDDKAIGEIRI